MRQHREQLAWSVDGPPTTDDERTKSAGNTVSLANAREAIARGVVAVLPHARDAVAPWLANSQPGVQQGSRLHLTFSGLGGTSLLAVEAAWRVSRSMTGRDTHSATERLPRPPMLTADDFLRGTLEETAGTLHGFLQMAKGVSLETVADGADAGFATTHAEPSESGVGPVVAAPQLPLVPESSVSSFAHSSGAGRKRRRLESGSGDQVLQSRPFLAVHRAGAGLHHSLACWGEASSVTGEERRAGGARVELKIRWSSCLSKCIDATPLVIVPKCTRGVADRSETDLCGETGVMAEKTFSRECFCHGLTDDAGRAVAVGEETASSRHPQNSGAQGVGEGTVYIGSHAGEFQALDLATGKRDWSFSAGGRIESGAACSCNGSLVFVGCHDRNLYALNRSTGRLSWSFETGDAIKCTPLCVPIAPYSDLGEGTAREGKLNHGMVLVGSHDGVLRSLYEVDGGLRWSIDCGGALFASPAQDADARVVYAATTKGRVVALDTSLLVSTEDVMNTPCSSTHATSQSKRKGLSPKHPTLLWDMNLPAPCFSSPVVCNANGCVVFGCVDGGLYCLSSNGAQVWVSCRGDKPVFSSPCLLPPLRKNAGDSDSKGGRMRVIWGCHDG